MKNSVLRKCCGLTAAWPVLALAMTLAGCASVSHQGAMTANVQGPDVTVCAPVQSIGEGACAVTPGNDYLLLVGNILTSETVYAGGAVLVSPDGKIAGVGCDVLDKAKALGPTVVTCPNSVVSPGLINAHDHITYDQGFPGNWGKERYDHRAEWRFGLNGHTKIPYQRGADNQVPWSELRQVISGTTSVAGSGGSKGFLRNLDMKELLEGLPADKAYYSTFPLGPAKEDMRADDCKYSTIDDPSKVLIFQCYLPHVAEGVGRAANNEIRCLNDNHLITPKGAFIHTVAASAPEAELLKGRGVSVVWSPRSNIALYGNTAPVTMYKARGLTIALATDWTPSGSMNLLRELKCADSFNRGYLGTTFSDKDLWMMVTANAADALKLSDQIGRLRPGLAADIAIFGGNVPGRPYRAVIDGDADKVALVLRGGKPLYGDADIMRQIPGGQKGCEPLPGGIGGVQKTVCVMNEIGKDFATLAKDNEMSYGLFYLGTPPGEPTCTPFRFGEYTGVRTPDDIDGDGIPNDKDNCPAIFNPARPMDGGRQPECR